MSQLSNSISDLFVQPPGDLLYFLLMIAVSQIGIFILASQRLHFPRKNVYQRYLLAQLTVVVAWLVLMLGAIYALVTGLPANQLLPPMEHGVNALLLVMMGWAFLSGDHPPAELSRTLLLFVILIAVSVSLTVTNWLPVAASQDFNLSPYSVWWVSGIAITSLLGMILLLLRSRSVSDAPLKLLFFMLITVGHVLTLLLLSRGELTGNYAGIVRLTQLAATVTGAIVIYRLVTGDLYAALVAVRTEIANTEPAVTQTRPEQAPSPVERHPMRLLKSLGVILEASTPGAVSDHIVRAAVELLDADAGLLLRVHNEHYADIVAVYTQKTSTRLSAFSLNLNHQPVLATAIRDQVQRVLTPAQDRDELRDLYSRLDIDATGPAYFQPLVSNQSLAGMLILLQPFSGREFTASEMELLNGFAIMSGRLLVFSDVVQGASALSEERAIQDMVAGNVAETQQPEVITGDVDPAMRARMQSSRDDIAQLRREISQLLLALGDERTRIISLLDTDKDAVSHSQHILTLAEVQEQLRSQHQDLRRQLHEAQTMHTSAIGDTSQSVVAGVIDGLQQEKRDLQAEKELVQAELDELRLQDRQTIVDAVELITARMMADNARLSSASDQLTQQIRDIHSQLEMLGVDRSVSGLARLVSQLYQERADLSATVASVRDERDALLSERSRFSERIEEQTEREKRLQALRNEIKHLASDREHALVERDAMSAERDNLMNRLDAVKQHRARLLAQVSGYEIEMREIQEDRTTLRSQIQGLADERSHLIDQRDRLLAERQSLVLERDQLLERFGDTADSAGSHDDEAGAATLQAMVESLSIQRNQIELELNQTRVQLAQVEQELRQRPLTDMQPCEISPLEDAQLLIGLVQELRTPMTSISGYVDLLLGESVGILGEMQRKFLQRVSASIQRLSNLIDDLVTVTRIDRGQMALSPEDLDLIAHIEDAITSAAIQFREKDLIVNLRLEDDLPMIQADREALSQVVEHLLSNACGVSVPGGEVVVTVCRQDIKSGPDVHQVPGVCVSVEDQGGGIQPEDASRVFERRYRADSPLVEGLGDTGVGLSIARAFVRAHGGRLWFETKPGKGSVFSFTLPLVSAVDDNRER